MFHPKPVLAAAAVVAALAAGAATAQDRQFINIGTAGVAGGYYPAGGYICNMVNRTRGSLGHNIRCSVEATGGSVANMRALRTGDLDIAFSQADWQYHAFNGSSTFAGDGANPDIRFLFSLQAEPIQIVTRPSTGITDFASLRGRVVNTGNAGSGTEATISAALAAYGETPASYFGQETKLTSREQAQALCDGMIEAFIFPVGIGTSSIVEAVSTCGAIVVPWRDATIDAWVESTPYMGFYTIPAGSYQGQSEPVETWGMPATVVATAAMSDDVIHAVVRSLFDGFDEFVQQSALFIGLTREGAARNGRSVPYHPGAERYYRETGLID